MAGLLAMSVPAVPPRAAAALGLLEAPVANPPVAGVEIKSFAPSAAAVDLLPLREPIPDEDEDRAATVFQVHT